MPLVNLYRKPQFITDAVVMILAAELREKVAELLSDGTLEHQLTRDEVEVRVTDGHPLDDNTCDIEIGISAKFSEGRKASHRRIVIELAEMARKIVPPMVGDSLRLVDTWIELDLGDKAGRKIWSKENLPPN